MASSISSGLLTASTQISVGVNRINAVTLIADGTNPASVIVYDNTTASGTVLAKVTALVGQGTVHVVFENPVRASEGLYLTLTGTNAEAILQYGG